MAQHSALYVVFLCAVCLLGYCVPRRLRYLVLLLFGYGFYIYTAFGHSVETPQTLQQLGFAPSLAAWIPPLGLLLFATLASWACGLAIFYAKTRVLRTALLCAAFVLCLAPWAVVHYTGFYETAFPLYSSAGISTELTSLALMVPLGLSYYSFQAAGYAFDVFTQRTKPEHNPLRYALFLSLFPGLFVGPINRGAALLSQISSPAVFSYNMVFGGLFRVLWGVCKKLVVANGLAAFTGAVFTSPSLFSGPVLVLAVLLFAYQLYIDFSACCDIAIGSARMLGYNIAENFARPFAAGSFAGLWRRWFMSLTALLRDVVYTPLVRSAISTKLSRSKILRQLPGAMGILALFTLLGLWHGKGVEYVLFGAVCGVLFLVSSLSAPLRKRLASAVPVYRIKGVRRTLSCIFVYIVFAACLTLFAAALYEQPLGGWLPRISWGWQSLSNGDFVATLSRYGLATKNIIVLCAGVILTELVEWRAITTCGNVAVWIRRKRFFVRWPLYYILLCSLVIFGTYSQQVGIYQLF